jgi:hypothetical protein
MSLNNNVWLIVFIVGINLSLFSHNVFGENLIIYATEKNGDEFYYNKDSVKRISGKVKVWVTIKYGDEGRNDFRKAVPSLNLENLSYTNDLYEINCMEKTLRLLNSICYDINGKVLYHMPKPTDWIYFPLGSIDEELKSRVCK